MANDVKVDVSLDTNKAEQDAGKLKGVLMDIGKVAAGIGAAKGIQELGGFLVDATKAAAEEEAAMARLDQAIRNSGAAFDESKAKIEQRIKAGQDLAFSDDDVRDSFQQLLAATGDVDEALKRQALAMDFARGAGIPLEQASKLLGKVTAENVEVFKRMGITIGEGATEAEAFAVIQGKFAGQSEAYAKSTAGQFEQAKIRMGEVKETIGMALLPVVTKLANVFLTEVVPAIEKFVNVAGPKIQEFAQDVKRYWESDIKPALDALKTAWDTIDGVIVPILQNIIGYYKLFATEFALAVGIIVDLISGDFSGAWDKLKQMVTDAIDEAKRQLGNLKDAMSELLPLLGAAAKAIGKAIFDGIWEGLGDLWQIGADIIDWVLQGLKAMAGGLIAEAKRIGGEIASALNPVNAIKGAGGALAGAIGLQVAEGGGGGSSTYVDPRGETLTANDILARRGVNDGFTGAPPLVINVGTMNVRDASDARQAAGDLRYALASAGLG